MNVYDLAAATGYLYEQEVSFLHFLVQSLPKGATVVNIGAGSGTSTTTILGANPHIILYSVDMQLAGNAYGSLEAERKAVETYGEREWLKRLVQLHGDSVVVGKSWTQKIHMVFVDGDHSYEGCKGDIETWSQHLHTGGIIAVHDYEKHKLDDPVQASKGWGGVDKAVHELLLGKLKFIGSADSLVAFRTQPNEDEMDSMLRDAEKRIDAPVFINS